MKVTTMNLIRIKTPRNSAKQGRFLVKREVLRSHMLFKYVPKFTH